MTTKWSLDFWTYLKIHLMTYKLVYFTVFGERFRKILLEKVKISQTFFFFHFKKYWKLSDACIGYVP